MFLRGAADGGGIGMKHKSPSIFKTAMLIKSAQQVVPQASAVYDGFNVRADKINADHRAMAQYSSRDDIGYRRVLSHMKRILAAHEEARREQGKKSSPPIEIDT